MKRMRWSFAVLILCGAGALAASAPRQASESPRVVEIHAKRFGFMPNQITLKRGETVKLLLTTEDVTHGFFQRALKIDEDIEAGKPTEITLKPDTAGSFTVICDHFCGSGHGNMKMTIVVE
jgi:cytochrome c oxidase subunit 2